MGNSLIKYGGVEVIQSVLDRFSSQEDINAITLCEFYRQINTRELSVVRQLFAIDPSAYGVKEHHQGLHEYTKCQFEILKQQYLVGDETIKLPRQYIPQRAYEAYEKMNEALHRDINEQLVIYSAYRSPACQILLFLNAFKKCNYIFADTVVRVSLPGYSDHGSLDLPAVDFADNHNAWFETTREYAWLTEHAKKYGFHLTYPKENKLGRVFKPWHWRFII